MVRLFEVNVSFAPTIASGELDRAARAVFNATDELIRSSFPQSPFELSVRVEQGSTKVRIGVSVTALTLLTLLKDVGEYGQIRQGAEILIADARSAANTLVRTIPRALGMPHETPVNRRTTLGAPAALRQLFSQVEEGRLSAEEAHRMALQVLTRDGDHLPPEVVDELKRAIEHMQRQPPSIGRDDRTGVRGAAPDDQTKGKPPRPRRSEMIILRSPERRVRRRGVIATRDATGNIRVRDYDVGD